MVGGEVVELVEEVLRSEGEVAAVAREHRVGGAVAEADGAGGAVCVGRGEGRVEDFQRVKTAGDERAEEIEGEDEGVVREAGGEDAGSLEQAEVRGDAGVGKDSDVFAPAEFAAKPIDAQRGRAESEVRGRATLAEGVEIADAEVATRDEDRTAGSAPAVGDDGSEESAEGSDPRWRCGLVNGAAGEKCDGRGVATECAEHGDGAEGCFTAEERGVSGVSVAEGRHATSGGEAHGGGDGGGGHGSERRS